MGKTIRDLAMELGISKQAVLYRLHRLEKENKKKQKLSTNKDGKIVLTITGESLIKSDYYKKSTIKEINKKVTIKSLQKEVNTLKREVAELQKQREITNNWIMYLRREIVKNNRGNPPYTEGRPSDE